MLNFISMRLPFFDGINLKSALQAERERRLSEPERLLQKARAMLEKETEGDAVLQRRMRQTSSAEQSLLNATQLPAERIFTVDDIQQLCVKYRLRFLDFSAYKGDLPYEALMAVKAFERSTGQEVSGLKIVAPGKLFELQEKDSDPLLLAYLGNDNYFLLHQWGKDLKWYRKLMAYPFRSLHHFIFTLVLAAFVFAQIVPIGQLPDVSEEGIFSIYRLYVFAFTLISFCSLSVFLLFTLRQNFSDQEWQSRYLS